jgi:hypothetical protein
VLRQAGSGQDYAKQAQDKTLRVMADRIQARAIRRCGELLKQIKPASKANLKQGSRRAGAGPPGRVATARAAGLSDRQRKTALRVANVPAAEFEKAVESPNPPTVRPCAVGDSLLGRRISCAIWGNG